MLFLHLFRYRLKVMLGDRMSTFWLIAFPMLLACLFRVSFPSSFTENMKPVPVAVVSCDDALCDAMDASGMFRLQSVDKAAAEKLLADEAVSGILSGTGDELQLQVADTGMNQTLLKSFLDTYLQRTATATEILTADGSYATPAFLAALSDSTAFVTDGQLGENRDAMLIFYYGLIGMAVVMGMTMGVENVKYVQANLSPAGMRVSLAPANKMTAFAASTVATIVIQFGSTLLLLLLLRFGFGLSLGSHPALILLFCLVGCTCSLLFGSLVSVLLPFGEGGKVGVLIAITMLGTTCAGTMSPELRYLVYMKFPPIAYISLPNLITDGFYALYYYDSVSLVVEKMGILAIFGAVGLLGTVLVLRRQSFRSI